MYARDMEKGHWQLNGEPIKFYVDGSLADGQHRLSAIISSGASIQSVVLRNLPLNISLHDRGRNRSTTDTLILDGMDKGLASGLNIAITKLHFEYQHSMVPSDLDIRNYIEKNKKWFFVLKDAEAHHVGNKKQFQLNTRNATIQLPCFYAVKSEECSPEDICDFLRILRDGVPDNMDQSAALVLRNDIIGRAVNYSQGGNSRKIAIPKIEKAIFDFSHRYQRKVSYGSWTKPIYSHLTICKEI